MAIEIVDLPINSMMILHSELLVYQHGQTQSPSCPIHIPCAPQENEGKENEGKKLRK